MPFGGSLKNLVGGFAQGATSAIPTGVSAYNARREREMEDERRATEESRYNAAQTRLTRQDFLADIGQYETAEGLQGIRSNYTDPEQLAAIDARIAEVGRRREQRLKDAQDIARTQTTEQSRGYEDRAIRDLLTASASTGGDLSSLATIAEQANMPRMAKVFQQYAAADIPLPNLTQSNLNWGDAMLDALETAEGLTPTEQWAEMGYEERVARAMPYMPPQMRPQAGEQGLGLKKNALQVIVDNARKSGQPVPTESIPQIISMLETNRPEFANLLNAQEVQQALAQANLLRTPGFFESAGQAVRDVGGAASSFVNALTPSAPRNAQEMVGTNFGQFLMGASTPRTPPAPPAANGLRANVGNLPQSQ